MNRTVPSSTLNASIDPQCGVCSTRFSQPATGRPQVYCSRACRQAAYRARQTVKHAMAESSRLRDSLSAIRLEFDAASRHLAATLAVRDSTAPDTPGHDHSSGWETEVAMSTRQLRYLADRIHEAVNDHSQIAYRYRSAGRVLRTGNELTRS
ncbi:MULTISPECIES: hypothetical protein [unclassified Nocardia]|uniref:hypothetical protein n=1 Tax=unclassified Nocardia TaxID=2637762 RepID=UPI0033A60077